MGATQDMMKPARDSAREAAMRLVVLFGIVSLLSDMTYEGARSVTGPLLATLGAGGTVVGLVAGLGEFIGYGLRIVSGYVSDKTGKYWLMTGLGYLHDWEREVASYLAGHPKVIRLSTSPRSCSPQRICLFPIHNLSLT